MCSSTNFYSGLAAEDIVTRTYTESGYRAIAHRWRGPGGEIDLIFEKLGALVFVEVKKSACFATAAARISQRQLERIYNSASAYLSNLPNGQLTEARIDAALVDGQGAVEIIENLYVN